MNEIKKQKKTVQNLSQKVRRPSLNGMIEKNEGTNCDFFSAKKMSPCYKVHKKNC